MDIRLDKPALTGYAKTLRAALAAEGFALSHTQTLTAIARMLGHASTNALVATLAREKTTTGEGSPAALERKPGEPALFWDEFRGDAPKTLWDDLRAAHEAAGVPSRRHPGVRAMLVAMAAERTAKVVLASGAPIVFSRDEATFFFRLLVRAAGPSFMSDEDPATKETGRLLMAAENDELPIPLSEVITRVVNAAHEWETRLVGNLSLLVVKLLEKEKIDPPTLNAAQATLLLEIAAQGWKTLACALHAMSETRTLPKHGEAVGILRTVRGKDQVARFFILPMLVFDALDPEDPLRGADLINLGAYILRFDSEAQVTGWLQENNCVEGGRLDAVQL